MAHFEPEVRGDFFLDIVPGTAYSFCVLGSTKSGKSYLINRLLDRYFNDKINILMTQSPNAEEYKTGFFSKHKDLIKCEEFHGRIIKDIFRIQKGTENKYSFNLIIDDCVGKGSDKLLGKVGAIGRNAKISCFMVGQTYAIVSPTLRSNSNFVFLGRMGSDYQIEMTIKLFLRSYFPSTMRKADQIALYKRITANNHFILINNLTNETYVSKIKG